MNDETPEQDDAEHTVVVPRRAAVEPGPSAADETVVAPRRGAPATDETVVVPRRAATEPESAVADETVVAPSRPAASPEETVVVPRRPTSAPTSAPGPAPLPGPDPEPSHPRPGPQLPTARAVYAARSEARQSLLSGGATQDLIGPPPVAPSEFAATAALREQLPSLERRSRRRRRLTLVAYAGVLIVSVAGLTAVINLAIHGS